DLHWADKSSLLLLQFLAGEIADARVLLLATYRDVEVSAGHPLGEVLPKLRRERTVDRILLRGLPDEDVFSLLVAMRGGEVPRTFADNLARETAGNPFFIREILRHLLDEGVAVREGNRWEPLVDEQEIRLPESVREVVGRRLARLGDTCRKMLTLASVLGNEFSFEALERASDGQTGLLASIEEAIAARVLEEVPQSIGRYRFSHALVRETLYEELGTVERLRLHRLVAEALERLYDRDPGPHLAELAHHFLEALPGGDAAKAVEYATRAGDRAVAEVAHDDATKLFGKALQALGLAGSPDERRRCELLLKLGEAQWGAGGSRDPSEPFRQAAEIAERLKDGDLSARAALGLGGPLVWIVNAERQYDFLDKALSMLEERDTPLRARVLSALASRRFFRPATEVHARPALEMARRLGDPSTLG
ncbi:MAG: ATP-binding protein, partial [Candidatus Binatia bacterium]